MKKNEKGFAISGILYGLFILFLIILAGILQILQNRSLTLEKTKDDIKLSLEGKQSIIDITFGVNSDDFPYSTFKVRKSGYYDIELWGASGGQGMKDGSPGASGGKGAYTSGRIYLNKGDTLYFYVGSAGEDAKNQKAGSAGGYNGGGTGGEDGNFLPESAQNEPGSGGGGATDVRLVSGTWNDEASLRSRIMVAGGGGGGTYSQTGGVGGSIKGGTGKNAVTATQTSGASFGRGGDGPNSECPTIDDKNCNSSGTSGGGGGYWGGTTINSNSAAGGGGSSYISGYAGVNSVVSSDSNAPSNSTLHYSGKYFINGFIAHGSQQMPSPSGSTETGHSGDGSARIRYVGKGNSKTLGALNNVRYIKTCMNGNTTDTNNKWNEIQAIKNGVNLAYGKNVTGTTSANSSYPYTNVVNAEALVATDYGMSSSGGLQCITVDLGSINDLDEIAVWPEWSSGVKYKNKEILISSDNTNFRSIFRDGETPTTEQNYGIRISAYQQDFPYTGSVQKFVASNTGYYKMQLWGASGGEYNTSLGGKGAYTEGLVYLNKDEEIYIYVGGKGGSNNTQANVGGYNGGGISGSNENQKSFGGGGATDITLFAKKYLPDDLSYTSGSSTSSGISLPSGAVQYGPYDTIPTGNYIVTVSGSNLTTGSCDVSFDGGNTVYQMGNELTLLSQSSTEIVYTFNHTKASSLVEFRFVASQNVTITSIEIKNLSSRIMVASGGAGSTTGSTTIAPAGGALNGLKATASNSTYNKATYIKDAATQTSGGVGYAANRNGLFGMGATSTLTAWGGGGGGGYYGGATGYGTTGSSGSSYISGYTGCVAVTSSSVTPRTGTGGAACTNGTTDNLCSVHYSGKKFIDSVMISGNDSIPGIASSTETGHRGNGYARITFVSNR